MSQNGLPDALTNDPVIAEASATATVPQFDAGTNSDAPDTTSTPFSVAVAGSVDGTIDSATDEDWYAVQLTEGQSYVIDLFGSGSSALSDPFLRVYDDQGNLLTGNDDSFGTLDSQLTFVAGYTGTYYLEADAYSTETGTYTLSVSGPSAPPPPPPSGFLSAIDWGTQVSTNVIDVYFAGPGETFNGQTSEGWNAYEIQQAMYALELISNVANVTFNQVSSAAGAEFKLVTITGVGYLGSFVPPGYSNSGNGVFVRDGFGWNETAPGGGLEQGGYGFITLLHEFGHGLGLAHPHDTGGTSIAWPGVNDIFNDTGLDGQNQGVYTTMTYVDGWVDQPNVSPSSANYGWQGSMMAYDIALLQQKYGANTTHNTGDTTYALPDANGTGTYFESIWDAGGDDDEITYAGTRDAIIDLRDAPLTGPNGGGYISYADGILGGYTIANGAVIENASTGSGNDTLEGNDANNQLTAGDGQDLANGRGGDDTITLGDGNDIAYGGAGRDTLKGNAGDDQLNGGDRGDTVWAGRGSDTVWGGSGWDTLRGDKGDDTIYGGNGNDLIEGGDGNDDLRGGAQDDILFGQNGRDVLRGGSENDVLDGGSGRDTLFGEAGSDRFDFNGIGDSSTAAADEIADFASGLDVIDVSDIDAVSATAADDAFAFLGQAAFSNTAGELRIASQTSTLSRLEADVDGDGVADFAIDLRGGVTLSAADFVL